MHKLILFVILILSIATYYFTGVGFAFTTTEQLIAGLGVGILLYLAGKKGNYQFTLAVLTFFSITLSLGCSFLSETIASGPFATTMTLSPWMILAIAGLISTIAWTSLDKFKHKDAFSGILLAVFTINWLILAVNVHFFEDWKMENWLTVPFVVIIYFTHRWFKLSNISYALIFIYMMLHIYGSHYTYAEVPAGFWMQHMFDLARNQYDRIVHFSFGLLLSYPLREMILRITNAKGIWGYWFPVEFVLAFSCIYELLEWAIAVLFGGDLGIAYLGSQGDVWDAQKDMFLAGLGSVVAMAIIACIVCHYRKSAFWSEMRDSLRVKHKGALGEVALERIAKE